MNTEKHHPSLAVWDLPTRLFHWLLVALVLLAWRTAETRDMSLHRMAGSAVAGLLVFRLWWGLFGSSTARFSQFLKGPRAVRAYARGLWSSRKSPSVGHNPMGGWSVAALLTCLLAMIGFGLFAVDTDGLESGPFANLVSFDQGRLASHLHAFAFDALEILVCLHLLAIAVYHLFKRQNLIGAMITGHIRTEGEPMRRGSVLMLVIGTSLGLIVTAALIHLSGDA
ncbi:cytochrome b/b6 domain-containing protein [Asticcacaulis sp. EMRT-3]|uniref:cytochrome b/b6 domain-containing protein n=1 Tax=Asticcacaulis sp. EMRT-3 TaxID=3040349 RepID=UPI0024AEF67C|nr:cytochrome b/b6 domain-containing protein [Asticcacaulis sp. EMRT-3]MDI7776270.1 cytochrome b/b6 domain-containing protein [Asticcacaulis sp. EMRT-3]